MPRIYVALDLEFTGLNPDHDAILEVGAVKFRGDEVLDTWSCLINPGRPLPMKVERLTGITQADIERAPSFRSMLPSLTRFVSEYPIVGHTVSVDLAFLQRSGMSLPNTALDTFELACILMPYASRYSLMRLAQELGIEYPTAHRALADAKCTHSLFITLLDRATGLNQKIIQEIVRLSDRTDWPLRLAFQDLLRDRARQAFAPGSIGAQLAAKGLADADENFGVLFSRNKDDRPLKPNFKPAPLDVDALTDDLSPGGLFAAKFPNFEYRAEQVTMLQAVADAFNNSGVLVVEAGTGTGKSLAYLLPAVHWAVQNNERVVISTNTINLQDQLALKDIPDLRSVVGFDCKFTVLKGRSNYLCRRRLEALRKQDQHSLDEIRVLAKVLAWLPSTTTGDVAELTLTLSEQKVWARLASDPEHCTPDRCGGNRGDKCFFWLARDRAQAAHLIIVNHALLLSDMALENRVLPEFRYLIVDEAHHLEARATDALSFEASRSSLDQLFRAAGSERSGLLMNLSQHVRHADVTPPQQRDFQRQVDDAAQAADGAQRAAYEFFNNLDAFLSHQQELPGETEGGYDRQYRLTPSRRMQPEWSAVEIEWDALNVKFMKLREDMEKIFGAWQDLDDAEIPDYDDLLQDILFTLRRIRETQAALQETVAAPRPQGIYWASVNKNSGDIGLHSAPLHVGELLNKDLLASRETVILTSATMSIGNSFTFIENRLGIGDWADELTVGSPFDYKQAALVYVPSDIPEPGQPGYQKAVESALADLLKATRGRALVLFTSHSQLQHTYRSIARGMEEEDILVLAQGLDGSRRQVLDTFRANERTALFGTKSFWEGVDVVGDALSCLVITRLPFSVPSDPIFSARSETFDDPFGQYGVPEAVLRFRQGFGRLIRSKSDRGVVVVLDKRVLTKSYGKLFIESLPDCTKQQGPLKELAKRASAWIDGAPADGSSSHGDLPRSPAAGNEKAGSEPQRVPYEG
ncbi:MAG: helicase C-terminal domain-containing protein [Anaerolineae bacterium]